MTTPNFTFASLPAIAAGLKNAEVISSNFVYNFFTPDERISESFSTFPVDGVTDQAAFAARIGKVPRYVRIEFSAPNYNTNNLGLPKLSQRIADGEKIIFETAPFNSNFSAIEVADTLVDNRSYLIASASLQFEEVPEAEGYNFTSPVASSATASSPKTLIFNALGNIQSSGYRYAKTDVRAEVKSQFLNDVRAFWTGFSLNNLFISDIANQVLKEQKSIFADEIAAISDKANDIQQQARSSSTPLKISSDAYDYTIPTNQIKLLDPDAFQEAPQTTYQLVGYVAQKFSQQIDGTLKIYDDLIFDVTSATSQQAITDKGVRYGGIYSYQIRAVYNITTYVAAQDIAGRGVGIAEVNMLFATAGSNVDVDCIETAPPRSPEDLYFKLENNGSLFIGWRFPLNPQRDIKKFQIFRRASLYDPFEIIGEIDFDDSFSPVELTEGIPKDRIHKKRYPATFFFDTDFNINSKFIYAIVSIDAHGLSSGYSTQLEISVNLFTESLIVKPVCRAGAPKPYPNLKLLADFFPDLIKDSGHKKMTVYFNPSYTDLLDDKGNSINVIAYGQSAPTYKIHILETNLAQDQVINITMTNNKIVRVIPVSEGKIYTQID